jgi:hypothetical protein
VLVSTESVVHGLNVNDCLMCSNNSPRMFLFLCASLQEQERHAGDKGLSAELEDHSPRTCLQLHAARRTALTEGIPRGTAYWLASALLLNLRAISVVFSCAILAGGAMTAHSLTFVPTRLLRLI